MRIARNLCSATHDMGDIPARRTQSTVITLHTSSLEPTGVCFLQFSDLVQAVFLARVQESRTMRLPRAFGFLFLLVPCVLCLYLSPRWCAGVSLCQMLRHNSKGSHAGEESDPPSYRLPLPHVFKPGMVVRMTGKAPSQSMPSRIDFTQGLCFAPTILYFDPVAMISSCVDLVQF